ncbi:MAG: TRAP transporter small permease subunit [Hyphomicrobiaceae bacterium]|nr:TRAP transporter small permease subunit [Hyphomicrobiaceae bacterium]
MEGLLRVTSVIDAISRKIGEWVSWLIVAAVVVSAGNAIIRKALNTSSNAWLEMQWYLFGAVFMLASAWTLQRREHIKVDLLYNNLSRKSQRIITLFGHIAFLLPYAIITSVLCGQVFWKSFQPCFANLANSYSPGLFILPPGASCEISGSAGGLVIWPAKFIMFAGFALLLAQGISELIKHIAVMRGVLPEPEHTSSHG